MGAWRTWGWESHMILSTPTISIIIGPSLTHSHWRIAVAATRTLQTLWIMTIIVVVIVVDVVAVVHYY